MSQDAGHFSKMVDAGINHLCDVLKLSPFVRAKCIEMSARVRPDQDSVLTAPVANAVASAIVSLVHEDARRNGRVQKHLPDRIIARVVGLNAVAVVHNRHLINSVLANRPSK